jgi:hypothetical protein
MIDAAGLEALFDRHAQAAYGYALLVTRHPKDARQALLLGFRDAACGPTVEPSDVRKALLVLVNRWAQQFRRTHLHWRRVSASAAVSGQAGEMLATLSEPEAQRVALLRLDGIELRDLGPARADLALPSDGTWTPPPASMRSLVLLHALEAAQPGRRLRRWTLLWLAFFASLALALGAEACAPTLPPPAKARFSR